MGAPLFLWVRVATQRGTLFHLSGAYVNLRQNPDHGLLLNGVIQLSFLSVSLLY